MAGDTTMNENPQIPQIPQIFLPLRLCVSALSYFHRRFGFHHSHFVESLPLHSTLYLFPTLYLFHLGNFSLAVSEILSFFQTLYRKHERLSNFIFLSRDCALTFGGW